MPIHPWNLPIPLDIDEKTFPLTGVILFSYCVWEIFPNCIATAVSYFKVLTGCDVEVLLWQSSEPGEKKNVPYDGLKSSNFMHWLCVIVQFAIS